MITKKFVMSVLVIMFCGIGLVSGIYSDPGALDLEWDYTTELPTPLAFHTAACHGDHIYVLGGHNGISTQATVYYNTVEYRGNLGSWQTTTPMPESRSSFAAVVWNDWMYVLGGYTSVPGGVLGERNTVWYSQVNGDGSLGSWIVTSPLPMQLGGHAAVVDNGNIYVMGGWNGYSVQSNVYKASINLDGSLGSWTTLTPLPSSTDEGAAVVYGDYIYMTGGWNWGTKNTVYRAAINPDGTISSWTTSSILPQVTMRHAVVVYEGHMLIIGGSDDGSSVRDTVYYSYIQPNGDLGSWLMGTPLPGPRDLIPSLICNDYIYITGGSSGGNMLTTVIFNSSPLIEATIDIDPNTIHLGGEGQFVTCYIELPEGYDVQNIDPSTILLDDTLSPVLDPKFGWVKDEESYIMDHDNDTVLERMVKFDRDEVEELLDPGTYNLKVTGELTDGTMFEGYSDEIRVIDPP